MKTARLAVETLWHDRTTGEVVVPAGEPVRLVEPLDVPDVSTRNILLSSLQRKQDQGQTWWLIGIRDWFAIVPDSMVQHGSPHSSAGRTEKPVRRTDAPRVHSLRPDADRPSLPPAGGRALLPTPAATGAGVAAGAQSSAGATPLPTGQHKPRQTGLF